MNVNKVISSKIIKDLPSKQQEVVSRRFGLKTGQKETLESIGRSFGITRERVRQIETDALERISKKKNDRSLQNIFSDIKNYLDQYGGVKKEKVILSDLGKGSYDNYIHFSLVIGDDFHHHSDSGEIYSFWASRKDLVNKAENLLNDLIKNVQRENRLLDKKEFQKISPEENVKLVNSLLEISKKLAKSPLGYFGLTDWPEVKPKGVRDRAYLALKKVNKPLHFREIAEEASSIEIPGIGLKKAYPQTVHNELIKDQRFVLVGRGIYGLKEWGYLSGTVKDVIAKILEGKNGLAREKIVKEVKNQRLVKENTILLNLQDKKLFSKDSQGKYYLV